MDSKRNTSVLLRKVLELLIETNILEVPKSEPVVKFLQPNELKKVIDLSIEDKSISDAQLESILKQVLQYSVKSSHPYFFNQLYGGVDPYGLAGSWITEAVHACQFTYEIAPVFTLIEDIVINKLLKVIGFQNGDGIFVPGGSMSNMYAMVLARYKVIPNLKTKGNQGVPLVAYTSEGAHYSFQKASHWLGIGTDNLIKVKTNKKGQMNSEELEKEILQSIEAGNKPFFVNATAGSTVLGSIDPIIEIAKICEKYKLWLNIDACWGGALLLSSKYKNRLKGIELADSVAWNQHKMLGIPLQCSSFLVKEKGIMHNCNSVGAKYLFQQDKFYDVSYDTGDKSVQCGRKLDAFKLWCAWKARGTNGLEFLINNAMDCANYLRGKVSQTEGFRLVLNEYEYTNVCFWYIPKKYRNQEETEDWWNQIDKVAPYIKEQITLKGSLMVGYTPLIGMKNFFRMIVKCQPVATYEDMDFVINEIQTIGELSP